MFAHIGANLPAKSLHKATFFLSFCVDITTQATQPVKAYVLINLCFFRLLGGPMEQGIWITERALVRIFA